MGVVGAAVADFAVASPCGAVAVVARVADAVLVPVELVGVGGAGAVVEQVVDAVEVRISRGRRRSGHGPLGGGHRSAVCRFVGDIADPVRPDIDPRVDTVLTSLVSPRRDADDAVVCVDGGTPRVALADSAGAHPFGTPGELFVSTRHPDAHHLAVVEAPARARPWIAVADGDEPLLELRPLVDAGDHRSRDPGRDRLVEHEERDIAVAGLATRGNVDARDAVLGRAAPRHVGLGRDPDAPRGDRSSERRLGAREPLWTERVRDAVLCGEYEIRGDQRAGAQAQIEGQDRDHRRAGAVGDPAEDRLAQGVESRRVPFASAGHRKRAGQ